MKTTIHESRLRSLIHICVRSVITSVDHSVLIRFDAADGRVNLP